MFTFFYTAYNNTIVIKCTYRTQKTSYSKNNDWESRWLPVIKASQGW